MRAKSLSLIVAFLLSLLVSPAPATAIERFYVDLGMVNHLAAGIPVEPFVFVETAPGSATVRRPNANDLLTARLFAADFSAASMITPDKFFDGGQTLPKGADLGMTLGAWLSAGGQITVVCQNDRSADVSVSFVGLVPNGVYNLFAFRFDPTKPPLPTAITSVAPLGAADGSNNRVWVNERGLGVGSAHVSYCPMQTGAPLDISLIYHFDGKTYGPRDAPQPPGVLDGIQLFAFL